MSKIVTFKGEDRSDALKSFLSGVLGSSAVDALLVPQEAASGGSVVPTIVKNPENLDPDAYAMALPVNAAPMLVQITDNSDTGDVIAAVFKPCEIRAAIELIKLNQINRERVLLIGRDCVGTYPVQDYLAITEAEGPGWTSKAYDQAVQSAQFEYGGKKMRSACGVCPTVTPMSADLIIRTIGVGDDKSITVIAGSERGEKALEGIEAPDGSEPDAGVVDKIAAAKAEARTALIAEAKASVSSKEGVQKVFSTCINCKNCMRACPICYCRECFFESAITDLSPGQFMEKASKVGTLKMPKDTLLFQMGRMNHMITSCVACGLCESSCPSNIPLLSLYLALGKDVQEIFEYIAGRSEEEPLPVAVYKSDELSPR